MKFFKKLYLDPDLKKVDKVLEKLHKEDYSPKVSLLFIRKKQDEFVIEVMDSKYLRRDFVETENLKVFGVACDKDGAFLLLEDLAKAAYHKDGKVDLISFLLEEEGDQQ